MIVGRVFTCLVFGWAAASTMVYAQGAQDCNAALVLNTKDYSYDRVTRLALAWHLDSQRYLEEKQKASATGQIYGVPAGADYENFRKSIQNDVNNLNINNFDQLSIHYATSGLDRNALLAYEACLDSESGIPHFVLETTTISTYVIGVRFAPSLTGGALKWSLGTVTNVDPKDVKVIAAQLSEFTPGQKISQQISIEPTSKDSETSIQAKLGTVWSSVLVLPPLKKIVDHPMPISLSKKLLDGSPMHVIYNDEFCSNQKIIRGTLTCNHQYSVQYNKLTRHWTVDGNSNYDKFDAPYQLNMWGHGNTFDDDGNVFDFGDPSVVVGTVSDK